MALTLDQRRRLQDALLDGCDLAALERVAADQLGQPLSKLVRDPGVFRAAVPELVDSCDAHGRVYPLLAGLIFECHTFAPLAPIIAEACDWDVSLRPPRQSDPTRPVPLELPARAEHFTGREQELGNLLADLMPGKVVILSGPGGIGKSALAAQAIWALAPKGAPPATFPDGIVFYSFYGRPSVLAAMEHIAICYGEETKPSPELAAQRALAGRTALLVLDGAEQADDLSALLDLRGNCCVLVTTRVHGGTDVAPLPADEAAALLRAWAGKGAGAGAEANKAVARICELVGNLPLAVRLAGAYMAECGVNASEYLDWLQQATWEALHHGEHQRDSVTLLLEKSVAALNDRARAALGVVGLLALQPFAAAWVAAALELEMVAAPRALGELVKLSLLQRADDGTYTVTHALIHKYARERLAPDDETVTRLAHCLGTQITELWKADKRDFAALNRLRPHGVTLVTACTTVGTGWEASHLAWAMNECLQVLGYYADLVHVLEHGLLAARILGLKNQEAMHLNHLGSALFLIGKASDAAQCFLQSISLYQETGDKEGEVLSLGNLGVAYRVLNDPQKAAVVLKRSLAMRKELGDRLGEANDLANLGNVLANLDQQVEAISLYQQALPIHIAVGDQRGQGNDLSGLGLAHAALGHTDNAIRFHEQALGIHREIGDRRGIGADLGNIGLAYMTTNDLERALLVLEEALVIHTAIGDRHGMGSILGNIGLVLHRMKKAEDAIHIFEKSVAIRSEVGDRRGEADDWGNWGLSLLSLGRLEESLELFQRAFQIHDSIGDRSGTAVDLSYLGLSQVRLGHTDEARRFWEEALRIYKEIKSPNAERVRGWLAGLPRRQS